MRWEAWVLVALFAANILMTVGMVGKPRQTPTAGSSVAAVIISATFLYLAVRLGT